MESLLDEAQYKETPIKQIAAFEDVAFFPTDLSISRIQPQQSIQNTSKPAIMSSHLLDPWVHAISRMEIAPISTSAPLSFFSKPKPVIEHSDPRAHVISTLSNRLGLAILLFGPIRGLASLEPKDFDKPLTKNINELFDAGLSIFEISTLWRTQLGQGKDSLHEWRALGFIPWHHPYKFPRQCSVAAMRSILQLDWDALMRVWFNGEYRRLLDLDKIGKAFLLPMDLHALGFNISEIIQSQQTAALGDLFTRDHIVALRRLCGRRHLHAPSFGDWTEYMGLNDESARALGLYAEDLIENRTWSPMDKVHIVHKWELPPLQNIEEKSTSSRHYKKTSNRTQAPVHTRNKQAFFAENVFDYIPLPDIRSIAFNEKSKEEDENSDSSE